ncbi:MAG: THUMP domain-containing class I SAM-dependent RNA methyltransferase [Bacteroidales bacterium]
MQRYTLLAKTLFGIEQILAEELKQLGTNNIQIKNRAVEFVGDKAMLYKANLHLRTAMSILKPIEKFYAHDPDRLYRRAKRIEWDLYFRANKTILIDCVSFGDNFPHSQFAALRLKDAIVDYFRSKHGTRPSVDKNNPDIRINLHIIDKQCSISLNSSGQNLNKRGYRTEQTEAPLNEVLAAGLVLYAGMQNHPVIHDPMSGSGTLAIEAAMAAANIAPGLKRKFSFEHWNDFDPELWKDIKTMAVKSKQPPQSEIIASDLDMKATNVCLRNAERAGVEQYMHIKNMDFFQSYPKAEGGLLIMNPPYGERLEHDKNITDFYNKIGDHLKQHYQGWEAWVFSGNIPALKHLGLKPSTKTKFFNGPMECRLHQYQLYTGSKKAKKNPSADT